MQEVPTVKKLVGWWEDTGQLWYAAVMLFVLVATVPLGIYGIYKYLAVGWLLTAVFITNTILAMFFLAHAAPLASVEALGKATILWLYNGALLLMLIAGAAYGGYLLIFR